MHAWKYPDHERRLAALAREAGFAQVSASHAVSPLLRLIPRGDTTVVDAYLSPILRRYVDQVAAELEGVRLYFMQSNGGLAEAGSFQGKDAILSGPAGGIVGAARTAAMAGLDRIIGFDMGGTSTDVALYAGAFERAFETEVAGVRMRAPMMAINTVAAGGGSILHFDGARLRVGPDSAGADPGPACYRRGGPLTVTDANVCVGQDPAETLSRDLRARTAISPWMRRSVRTQFAALADRDRGGDRRDDAILERSPRGSSASPSPTWRTRSSRSRCRRGTTPRASRCNASAAPAASTPASSPTSSAWRRCSSTRSRACCRPTAWGSPTRRRCASRRWSCRSKLHALIELQATAERLAGETSASLAAQGAESCAHRRQTCSASALRGNRGGAEVPFRSEAEIVADFTAAHRARFGFATPDRPLVVEAVAVEAVAAGETMREAAVAERRVGRAAVAPIDHVSVFSGGAEHEAPVFDRTELLAGDRIGGPALIREANATTVIEPGWTAEITKLDHMTAAADGAAVLAHRRRTPSRPDPVLLELFNNLFMNVAEQTGAVLQNTSMSVNIKERLDFSCAIFDAEGGLVANAPHVPVHLGAMGESVRTVLRHRRKTLKPGDVVALNNPFNGGTHLPDVTVITPVFDETGAEILFFVGSRGHHADIGGITPGSTPPDSRTLEEEGVVHRRFPAGGWRAFPRDGAARRCSPRRNIRRAART